MKFGKNPSSALKISVAKFLLTNRAASDLSDIADFTIQTFGIEQARFYRDGLNHCFEILIENPQRERNATDLAPNLKRFEYQSHAVFDISKVVAYFGRLGDICYA